MTVSTKLQDAVLKEMIEETVPATVFLMNGFQIRGIVIGFDDAVVALEVEGRQQMIFKHAISTIIPMRQLKSMRSNETSTSGW